MSILKEGVAMSNSRRFTAIPLYAENEIREATPSNTKADRGVLYVEARGINQKGAMGLTRRHRVLVARVPEEHANRAATAASSRRQRKLKNFS
jgi:hypothetical protein